MLDCPGISLNPVPCSSAGHVHNRLITFHSHVPACAPTSPSSSSTADHRNADPKLANWNGQNGIEKMPATIGTEARNGPEKRAMTIAHTPHLRMNSSPCGSRSGWRVNGHILVSAPLNFAPIQ